MPQTVRGVISRSKMQPVELMDIVIPDPGPGEVVVDIVACGVCHTDLAAPGRSTTTFGLSAMATRSTKIPPWRRFSP